MRMRNEELGMRNAGLGVILVLAMAVAGGCSMGEAAETGGLTEVRFSSGIEAAAQNRTAGAARAAGAAWAAGDGIGIYMVEHGTTVVAESAENIKYTAASAAPASGFSAAGTKIYYPANKTVDFFAYYPHQTPLDNWTYQVDVSTQGTPSDIDLMWSGRVANGGDGFAKNHGGAVNLAFAHKLVKLEFKIARDDSVTAALDGLEVYITGQATAGTMDLADGTVGTTNSGQTITAKTAGNGTSAEAIVFPAGDNTGVRFKFTNTEGELFTGAVPSPGSGWTGGNKYIYTVTLKKNEAGITGTVAPWVAGNGDGEAVTGAPTLSN